ncbi:hypothetical protein B0T16DRAFT_418506 [Cercophora newfieldiana]|uniref:Uncharacterized protein n=1 Tax=Cercophora newfieldiana TaxID=92897 RepID=A0AA39XWR8_9PEZI|nr:hypothetical protein B0T16DRAFT_418506 [Cercophora newfieldiana]
MKTYTIFTATLSLVLTSQAAVLGERADKNTPGRVIAKFNAGTAWDCKNADISYTGWSYQVVPVSSTGCTPFPNGIQSVTVTEVDPHCLVTVFTQPTCSDAGVVLGVGGCFSNAPQVYGYKLTCPY